MFSQDDISEKKSTESRGDLSFEGLRLRTYGRMYSLLEKKGHRNSGHPEY